jgi:hypothetical protein
VRPFNTYSGLHTVTECETTMWVFERSRTCVLQVVGGLTGKEGMKERGKAQESHGDHKQVRLME